MNPTVSLSDSNCRIWPGSGQISSESGRWDCFSWRYTKNIRKVALISTIKAYNNLMILWKNKMIFLSKRKRSINLSNQNVCLILRVNRMCYIRETILWKALLSSKDPLSFLNTCFKNFIEIIWWVLTIYTIPSNEFFL